MTQTEWVVLTGPPSSGKTTTINRLRDIGYLTSPDISRNIILSHMHSGKSAIDVRKNQYVLQTEILAAMIEAESKLKPTELVFLDYALPDNLAFCALEGVSPKGIQNAAKAYRYKHVFICDPFCVVNDEVRIENNEFQGEIFKKLIETYNELAYRPYRLPPVSVKERVDIVINIVVPQQNLWVNLGVGRSPRV